jgi:hypothetical protein
VYSGTLKYNQHLTAKTKLNVECLTIPVVLVDIILQYSSWLYLVTCMEGPRHQILGSVKTVTEDSSFALGFEGLTAATMKSTVSKDMMLHIWVQVH